MLKSGESILVGVKIAPQSPQQQATVALLNKQSKIKFHEVTGHTGLKYLRSTANVWIYS